MLDFDDYVGNLLAALVSLRTFEIGFDDEDEDCPIKDDLSFIQKVSDRAPHLEHFALDPRCYKKVAGNWVTCGSPGIFRSHFKGECAVDLLASTLCPE
jgi:hypothetical protein